MWVWGRPGVCVGVGVDVRGCVCVWVSVWVCGRAGVWVLQCVGVDMLFFLTF